jgi:hypothetical protein
MTKLLSALAITAAILAATPAVAADVSAETKTTYKKDSEGDVKKSTEAKSTDASGTTTKSDAEVKLDVDSNGDATKTVTTEQSTDPKGLFNKTSTKTKDQVKTENGKTTAKHKKVVNGETVEKTETK